MPESYQSLVTQTFQAHGVDNKELENAITDILNHALDSRELSKRIWEDVKERIDREQRVRDSFK
ncbi:hypothetical protein [Alkalibacillus almallahensis]|uniref:hypothetical protein n=1 Tax=Alkalibacillus almallahensis TaxID=1379154 RepID=UPI00141DBD5E|nr:hypothetical protein [Alkalibacillus almallahensis]NIK10933.1 hypothetical protein [Alkalibacillus almallahensis]